MNDSNPLISRRYSSGARLRRPSLPGSIVSDVETPVWMHSSITLHIFIIWDTFLRHIRSHCHMCAYFVVNIFVGPAKVFLRLLISEEHPKTRVVYGFTSLSCTICAMVIWICVSLVVTPQIH
jgi:hypothetical protein